MNSKSRIELEESKAILAPMVAEHKTSCPCPVCIALGGIVYALANEQQEPSLITNKWIGLLKTFDGQLAGEWHSGSCIYIKAQAGFATKEEAEAWVKDIIENYYKNNRTKYQFTECYLNYDATQSVNLKEFIKLMR
jgi:hypothetical protein